MVVKHRNRSVDDRTNSVLGPLEVWVILLRPGHFTVPRYGSDLCPSMGEWTKKMIHTHTHTHTMDYYSTIKKNEMLPLATMWHGPGGYHVQ